MRKAVVALEEPALGGRAPRVSSEQTPIQRILLQNKNKKEERAREAALKQEHDLE
jgi:hypothetical protein